ncbi:hypothetical protein [Anaerorudis cellulosivorans]|nr:hypothetical protein [Seramator thermalis]MCW1734156.1 hypothetical protein [Seramator thermalis]
MKTIGHIIKSINKTVWQKHLQVIVISPLLSTDKIELLTHPVVR